jgi:hypothetical protein
MSPQNKQSNVEIEEIRLALGQSPAPLTAAALSKSLKRKGDKAFQPTLDAYVAEGQIFAWAKNYWDKDPRSVARERLLAVSASESMASAELIKRVAAQTPKISNSAVAEVHRTLVAENRIVDHDTVPLEDIRAALAQSAKPASASQLAKALKSTGKRLQPALDRHAEGGAIFRWPKNTYWDSDPNALRERLLDLTAREFPSQQSVKEMAAKDPAFAIVLKELVSDGTVRVVDGLYANVQSPGPFLEAQIARLLAEFGIERPATRIRGLLLDSEPVAKAPDAEPRSIAEALLATVNRTASSPGTSVTFYRLRQQPELADIPKASFDKAALLLQQDRKALLTIHDHASRLPKAEQDELVTDGFGNYYVSIYAL